VGVRRKYLVVGALVAGLVVSGAVPIQVSAAKKPTKSVDVLLEGLNSPKGLALDSFGDLVVAQGAFGPPDPVLVYLLTGKDRGDSFPVTDAVNLVDVAISPLDDTGWGIGPVETGEVHLFHQLADGTVVDVLDIFAYQATDPDPVDQDIPPNPGESNPYGLTVTPEGDALIADAAGNDIIKVTPDGVATTVARFDLEVVATDHLPPEFGLPPEMTAEAVPTSVTIGPDGAIYVGQLMGFPFRPGSSHVWRIDADADGVRCSVTDPDDGCEVYASGFTAIQDIAFNPHNGRLYVYELAEEGVFAFEEGFDENGVPVGPFPPAVLLKVSPNGKHNEIAAGQLSEPGGIVVASNGKVYVTDGVFTGGRLAHIKG
jgi:hypothetical protein